MATPPVVSLYVVSADAEVGTTILAHMSTQIANLTQMLGVIFMPPPDPALRLTQSLRAIPKAPNMSV